MMRVCLLLLALMTVTTLRAQQFFEEHEKVLPTPVAVRPQVEHFVQIALAAANLAQPDSRRNDLLAAVAACDAGLEDYEQATRLADSAYPSGSEAQATLGRVLALQGKLAQPPRSRSS